MVPIINGEPSRVLIRFYGQNNNVHELENQVKVFKIITRKELGPKLFGEFEGGRLEEFLPARPLSRLNSKDPQISAIVAKRLATIHNLDVPIQKCNTWLVNKYEEFLDYINDNIKLFDEHELQSSTKLIAKQMLLIDFSEEIRFLGDQFEKSTSPVVFSHNDLHRGNILFTEVSKTRSTLADRIVLIDFEYSSYNYRGYDIANYFLEAAFEYEPSKYPFFSYIQDRFPSKSECLTFIRHYLNKMSKISSRRRSTTSNSLSGHHFNSGDNMLNYEILCKSSHDAKNPNAGGETYEEKVLQELEPFLMASHLFWILWSIKNGIASDKSFGFWVSFVL